MPNRKPSSTRSQNVAALTTTGAGAVIALSKYAGQDVDLVDLAAEIGKAAEEVRGGDLARIEGILVGQILLLNCVSSTLLQRAPASGNFEGFVKIALKCQVQCAKTAEVVVALKNPMSIFREADFERDHQRISTDDSGKGSTENAPDELLTPCNDPTLDPRRTIAASEGDSRMATVVCLNRTPNRGRKGQGLAQCR